MLLQPAASHHVSSLSRTRNQRRPHSFIENETYA